MTRPMTAQVLEGRTRLVVPVPVKPAAPPQRRRPPGPAKGPASAASGAFYNPAMRFARDLSVLFHEVMMRRKAEHGESQADTGVRAYRFLDALAATGARVVRVANEARVPAGVRFQAVAVDRDPDACALIAQNIARNGVAHKVGALRDDMHRAAGLSVWDHVDVDPFGSPALFLDSAVRRLGSAGTLAVTATDTAALTGSAPAACRRRYDAKPWHGPAMHEAALRILAGAAVRTAARHEVALRPVLMHATDHYVRVYLQASKGARRTEAALDGLGFAVEDSDGTVRIVKDPRHVPGDAMRWAGPMWAGPLHDVRLAGALDKHLGDHGDLEMRPLKRFFAFAQAEADASALFYELGVVAKKARCGPPPMDRLLEAIRESGHQAERCHASPTGVKTDLRYPELVRVVAETSRET